MMINHECVQSYGIPFSRGIDFDGTTVGLAFIGTLCSDHSTGVVQVYNSIYCSQTVVLRMQNGMKQKERKKNNGWPNAINIIFAFTLKAKTKHHEMKKKNEMKL